MGESVGLTFLIAVGTAGMYLFRLLRFPQPAMLGSLFLSTLLAVTDLFPTVSLRTLSFVSKIAIGVMTGRRINRDSIKTLRHLAIPALIISGWMLGSSLISGVILYALSPMPLSTALVGSAAGGITEMAIFALSQDYDVTTITFIQVVRLVAVLSITPWIIRRFTSHSRETAHALAPSHPQKESLIEIRPLSLGGILFVILCALLSGRFFEYIRFPAGAMIGAMLATGAIVLTTGKNLPFSLSIRNAAQIGMGVTIASRIDYGTLLSIGSYLPGISVSTLFILSSTVTLGLLLRRWTGWDSATCLLASSAGGLSQMIVFAEETQCDPLKVSILHLARYLSIIAGMPFVITLILN